MRGRACGCGCPARRRPRPSHRVSGGPSRHRVVPEFGQHSLRDHPSTVPEHRRDSGAVRVARMAQRASTSKPAVVIGTVAYRLTPEADRNPETSPVLEAVTPAVLASAGVWSCSRRATMGRVRPFASLQTVRRDRNVARLRPRRCVGASPRSQFRAREPFDDLHRRRHPFHHRSRPRRVDAPAQRARWPRSRPRRARGELEVVGAPDAGSSRARTGISDALTLRHRSPYP